MLSANVPFNLLQNLPFELPSSCTGLVTPWIQGRQLLTNGFLIRTQGGKINFGTFAWYSSPYLSDFTGNFVLSAAGWCEKSTQRNECSSFRVRGVTLNLSGDPCGGVGRTWCLHQLWVSSSARFFQASFCMLNAGWVECFVSLVFSSPLSREKLSVAFGDLVFCTCCVLLNEFVSEGSCDWIILLLENVHLSRQKLSLGAMCSLSGDQIPP